MRTLDQGVDIVLQIGVAVARNLHTITLIVGIQPIRRLPRIGDTITIRIRRRRPAGNAPRSTNAGLVRDERALLAPGADLGDKSGIDGVTDLGGADLGEDDLDGLGGGVDGVGGRVGEGAGLEGDVGVAGRAGAEGGAVQGAIAVGVVEVVADVWVFVEERLEDCDGKGSHVYPGGRLLTSFEVLVATSEGRDACAWA